MKIRYYTKILIIALFFQVSFVLFVSAQDYLSEFDILRADLACQKDKTTQNYIKTKQKLNKLIKSNNIDYTLQARFEDISRLIEERKFNAAKYELNDLIENEIEISKCYEYLGDIALQCKNPAALAAKYYKLSLRYDNENIEALYKLSKLYLSENKNILGIEYLKKTIELSDNRALLEQIEDMILNKINPHNKFEANNLYEALGQIYTKFNENEKAYVAYFKALKLNPDDIYLKYYLADLLYTNNINQDAIALYGLILDEFPNDSQIRNSRAKTFLKEGKIKNAYEDYLSALAKYPDSKQAKYGIYKIYKNTLPPDKILEKIYINNKNYSPKRQDFSDFALLLDEFEDSGSSVFRDYAEKMTAKQKETNQLKQKMPDKIKTKQKQDKADFYEQPQKQKEPDNKLNLEQQIIQKAEADEKTRIENYKKEQLQKETQKEQLEAKQKAHDIAVEKERLSAAIKQEEKSAIARDSKKYKVYKTKIDGYLNTTPMSAQLYIAAANTYKLLQMPNSALKYFEEAKKLDPVDSDIYYNIGLLNMELNRLVISRENLEKAINLDKDNSKAHNMLNFVNQKIITQIINSAYGDFEEKKYIKAFETLDNGIKKYPKNAQLYYYRALVSDSMNRNAAAIIDLQKAIELNPALYMAYYQLGKTYEKIKDEKSALVAYERFLSVEPEEAELIEEVQKKVINLGKKYY